MELYASEYERQLKTFRGVTGDWTPGLVVRMKSSAGSDVLMVQSFALWKEMLKTWDGHLWAIWPRPVADAHDAWEGFYAYYEMRPFGGEQKSVFLCTIPEIQTYGSTPVRVVHPRKETE